MDSREAELLEVVAGLEDQLVQWTKDLVAIPTVNPYSGDDSAGSEAPGQEWVADRFRELGAEVRQVPVPADVYARGGIIGPAGRSWEGRDNVVAEWALGTGRGTAIVINDHMDTVGTAGMDIEPFDPQVRDGRLYGRGSSDTKGNLAMGMVAVKALLQHADGLNGRILYESVVDEECNGAGAGTLACCLAGVTGDVALCLDGDTSRIDIGCNGVVTARVVVSGEGGHGSGSGSVSALDKGIVAKEAIDAFAASHNERFPHCPVNIGVFRAGTLPAIVPGEAELQINLNYDLSDAAAAEEQLGGWDGSLFRERFEQAMGGLAQGDEWFADRPAEVSWIKDMYPFACEASDPAIVIAAEAASEMRGSAVEAVANPAWFDGAHLARQLGIPVAGMGYGTPGCPHAAVEYVLLDDLFEGARAVALTLYRLLRG
ncbi:M20 family metallopeptidase [Candidatus Latescibacterota bacterium]